MSWATLADVGPWLRTFARENRSRRKLHASKEKGKEEKETLVGANTIRP
jgi:hypothetical protein